MPDQNVGGGESRTHVAGPTSPLPSAERRKSYRGGMVDPRAQSASPRVTAGSALPWAVVGAGAHGLAALKALLQFGVGAEGLERAADVGGLWNSASPSARGYDTLHMISTKPFSQFPDFPMPPGYPDYPSRDQAQDYLRRYASHFGLYDHIRFGCEVLAITPEGDGVAVTVRDLLTGVITDRRYGGVVIANGHHGTPYQPAVAGLERFAGQVLHAAHYRSAQQLRDQRVLVVGGGNSGCDIAVDAGLVAARALHSTRSGLRLTPKYAFGRPIDQLTDLLLGLRVPDALRRAFLEGLRRTILGGPAGYGWQGAGPRAEQRPDAVNQMLPTLVGHGRVEPKPGVERFEERTAVFVDGSTADIDVVVFATGYHPEFGFADAALLPVRDGLPVLTHGIFPPAQPAVAVAGLVDSDSGQWPIAHWQGMLIAQYALARRDRPQEAEAFATAVRAEVVEDPRGPLAVAHQEYLRLLEDDIRMLEGAR